MSNLDQMINYSKQIDNTISKEIFTVLPTLQRFFPKITKDHWFGRNLNEKDFYIINTKFVAITQTFVEKSFGFLQPFRKTYEREKSRMKSRYFLKNKNDKRSSNP